MGRSNYIVFGAIILCAFLLMSSFNNINYEEKIYHLELESYKTTEHLYKDFCNTIISAINKYNSIVNQNIGNIKSIDYHNDLCEVILKPSVKCLLSVDYGINASKVFQESSVTFRGKCNWFFNESNFVLLESSDNIL